MAKQKVSKTRKIENQVSQVTKPVADSARDVWLAGLGAFSVAQQESDKFFEQGNKLFDKLVSEGQKLEKSTRKSAEANVADLKKRANKARNEFESNAESARKQVAGNWDKLEGMFEQRVRQVLNRVGVATSDELNELTARLDELNKRVSSVTAKTAKTARRKKPATRKAAVKSTAAVATAKSFHLLPDGDSWVVRAEGANDDISVHKTKRVALNSARGVAQANEPSHLVVHRADGTIQTSYAYGDNS